MPNAIPLIKALLVVVKPAHEIVEDELNVPVSPVNPVGP